MSEHCENCKHWVRFRGDKGHCHRRAPYVDIRNGLTRWPMVEERESCGQYEGAGSPARAGRGESRGFGKMVCTEDGGVRWASESEFQRLWFAGEIEERREGGIRRYYLVADTGSGGTSEAGPASWSGDR